MYSYYENPMTSWTYYSDHNPAHAIDEVCPGIFIGGVDAREPELLQANDIRHVIGLLTSEEWHLLSPKRSWFQQLQQVGGENEWAYNDNPTIIDTQPRRPDKVHVHETLYDVDDGPPTNLTKILPEIQQKVKAARDQQENVLIHCRMGVSRSASATIGVLMANPKYIDPSSVQQYLTYKTSHDYLKSKRSVISPHHRFIRQLQEYESVLIKTFESDLL